MTSFCAKPSFKACGTYVNFDKILSGAAMNIREGEKNVKDGTF